MTLINAFEKIGLKPVKKTSTEYGATCPACGGKDRCIIWPNHKSGKGKFYCRQCGKQGDEIDFLKEFCGMSYQDACKAIGKPISSLAGERAVWERNRQIPSPARHFDEPKYPPKKWMEKAEKFLSYCQTEDTLESTDSIEILIAGRKIPPFHCKEFGIGWNDKDWFVNGEDWGLPNKKIRIPKGIVIATKRKAGIVKLVIRTVTSDSPKYWQIVGGSQNIPYIPKFEPNKPIFIFESELDAALIASTAGEICNAVGIGGLNKKIDVDSFNFIQQAPLIILSPDNDDRGNEYVQDWQEKFPNAWTYQATGAKDIGEMNNKAASLDGYKTPTAKEWAIHAIEHIFSLKGKKD